MFRFTILALLVGIAFAGKVEFDNCGSLGIPISVDIEGCDRAPCELVKSRTYNVEVHFQPKSDSDSLTLNIVGKVSIITIPIVEMDACQGLSSGCPYKGGILNSHKFQITINADLIETDARIEYRLKNEEGAVDICISLPVRVVSIPSY